MQNCTQCTHTTFLAISSRFSSGMPNRSRTSLTWFLLMQTPKLLFRLCYVMPTLRTTQKSSYCTLFAMQFLTGHLPLSRRRWPLCRPRVAGSCWWRPSVWTWWGGWSRPAIPEREQHSGQARSSPMRRWPACNTARRWWGDSMRTLAWTWGPLSGSCIRLEKNMEVVLLTVPREMMVGAF